MTTPGTNAAESRVTLSRSVAPIQAKVAATARALDARDLAGTLNFSVALQMRDFAGLEARVARGETISREELERLYLPLPSDYEAVKTWLRSQGFTINQEDGSRLSVFTRGTVEQIQTSLQVSMVKVTVEGVDYAAASTQPSLPASVAAPVLGINGLHPYHHLHKHSRPNPLAVPSSGYKINNILTTYDAANLGVTGVGQTIAILIDATPLTTDLTKFWTNNSSTQTTSNVTTINVNNATITGREGEETLDVEWAGGIAPGAKIRVYATGTLDDANLDAGLARIISDLSSDSTIHQLSISLGLGETYETNTAQFTTDHNYFTTLASQGVSTFVSSGDGGSTPDDGSTTAGDAGPLQVEYYSSDPSVTAVGGTSVNVVSTSNFTRSTETAWSGSGGGVSIQFAKPSWQVGTGVPTGTKRYVPDVAMPADPNTGAYVYYGGSAVVYGGTSWAAPTWAGFCALMNQARANAGKTGGIGLLNPSVYPLIGSTSFYDIVSGNNAEGSKAGGKYSTTTGYDPVTGVGVPDVKNLIAVLTGTTTVSAPTITSFTPTSGAVGASVTLTGTNFTGATAVSFNGTAATSYTVSSATQIVASVPTGATTGTIKVTTSGGTATSTASFTVTTTASVPTITSFTPTSGTVGTSVTLTGTNLTGATAVSFNGTATTSYTVSSATQIVATVPTGATTGTIKVTTAGGTATSSAAFTVTTSGGTSSTTLVISQVYGGGGSASATYTSDYVELYNPGTAAVDLSTYSIQYASATGTTYAVTKLSGSITAKHYFLVQEATGSGSASLPVAANVTGTTAMSATAGKVALVSSQTALSGSGASTGATVVDYVGYGTTASEYKGTGPAPAPSTTTADLRGNGGATNTKDNASDFTAGAPNPRNSGTSTSKLALDVTHNGNFVQGDTGDSYLITVSNSGTDATSDAVTVATSLPSGLTATAISGTGWTTNLNTLTCTRSDALAAGSSYPPITLLVSVASTAPSTVTNTATVSGGSDSDTASHTVTINAMTASQSWRYQYFGTNANSGNAADLANPAGDGLANLVKYALGLNPLAAEPSPVVEDVSTGHLRLTIPKNPAATDLIYRVQVTSDLSDPTSWTTDDTTVDQSTSSLLQVHDNAVIGSSAKRFIRLQINR